MKTNKTFEKFNNQQFNARLEIILTENTTKLSPNLMNCFASPTATVNLVKFNLYNKLSKNELSKIIINKNMIVLESFKISTKFSAPNGTNFTVTDIIKCIEEHETLARINSKFFGGIDVHHVLFEGLELMEGTDDTFHISWGS